MGAGQEAQAPDAGMGATAGPGLCQQRFLAAPGPCVTVTVTSSGPSPGRAQPQVKPWLLKTDMGRGGATGQGGAPGTQKES